MTPLAHMIVADSTLPIKQRRFDHVARELRLLDDVHFFEISQVNDLLLSLDESMQRYIERCGKVSPRLAFLPAARTWIEQINPGAPNGIKRYAMLLERVSDELAEGRFIGLLNTGEISAPTFVRFSLPLLAAADPNKTAVYPSPETAEFFDAYVKHSGNPHDLPIAARRLYTVLAFINTPRIIGRRQVVPHAGLQRKLAAAMGMVGKFPLRAWTELKLEVRPPRIAEGEPHRAGYTGEKAYHWTRMHVRIQNGLVVYVTDYWSGNVALGIKQTRYALVPPKSGRRAA